MRQRKKISKKRHSNRGMSKIIIKNEEQINGIRKSCKLAAQTLKFIEPYVVVGVTTNYLNNLVETYIRDHGAVPAPLGYMGYPKATCTSLNEVICHGIPDETVLKDGDILNIDVTTILDGYYGDTSTMFAIGNVSEEASHLLGVTKKCLEIGIKQVRPGNFFGDIGYYIWQYAMLNNCSVVVQYCGHGVGLNFHEQPHVSHMADKGSGARMEPGMIFTIEPMINQKTPEAVVLSDGWTAVTKDGGLSAQYEHTVLVTTTGYEILTDK